MAEKYFTKTTPYIRPITQSGGTFYTFNSASEDFGLSFSDNSTRKFIFSKFALIKIPEFSNDPNRYQENLVRLKAIPGAFNEIEMENTSNVNMNLYFAESLQNYMLNFETSIISNENYNQNNPHTVSEYAFWKWLKELGAIRFKSISNSNSNLFTEEDDLVKKYEKVVKYIGELDVSNNYFGAENSYFEVYYRIPADAGQFKNIYFTSQEDENYKPDMVLTRNDISSDKYYILGRTSNDVHPIDGFSNKAFYDYIDDNSNVKKYKYNSNLNSFKETSFEPGWWTKENVPYSYETEQRDKYFSAKNEIYALTPSNTEIDENGIFDGWTIFTRSTLDGINISFNINDYLKDYTGRNYSNFTDIATSPETKDFEFNAVLIYYDLIDNGQQTTNTSSSDSNNNTTIDRKVLATNLFGVYFLDNVNVTSEEEDSNVYVPLGSAIIPSIQKCVPNKVTQNSGNAFNGRIKFKIDASPIDAYVNKITEISNGNTISMDMFLDALSTTRKMSSYLIENLGKINSSTTLLNELESNEIYKNPTIIENLKSRIDLLEKFQTDFNNILNINSLDEIHKLIIDNNSFMNDIKNGNLSAANVSKTLFRDGTGIYIDRITYPNNFVINLKNTYNISDQSIVYDAKSTKTNRLVELTGDKDNYTYTYNLLMANNYIKFKTSNWILPKNIILNINDSDNTWVNGQIVRIVFDGIFDLKTNKGSFIINTKFLNNTYTKNIATILSANFSNSPIFEIICIDAINNIFEIDTLK